MVTPKVLIDAQFALLAGGVAYTAPAEVTATIVDKFTAYNADTNPATLTIWLLKSGLSHAASNLLTIKSISAGATADITEMQNQILNSGDSIYVQASTAGVVSNRASGREVKI